jgi:hypothetical protein
MFIYWLVSTLAMYFIQKKKLLFGRMKSRLVTLFIASSFSYNYSLTNGTNIVSICCKFTYGACEAKPTITKYGRKTRKTAANLYECVHLFHCWHQYINAEHVQMGNSLCTFMEISGFHAKDLN